MPAAGYVGEDFFVRERDLIFARHWTCIGLAADVPGVGDVKPLTLHGRSMVLVRGDDERVRVFHNVCRHRGHPVVMKAASGRRRLVCPYHSWSYGLDGRLAAAPHAEGLCGNGAGEIALKEVRSADWHGIVFIDLSGAAVDFARHIAPLEQRWADHDLSALRHGESLDYDLNCNWKLAIENFVDFYHLPSVHKGLNSYSRMEDHDQIDGGPLFFGQGNRHCDPQDAATGRLPRFPGLPQDLWLFTEAVCLFPNLLVTLFADHLRIILVEPTAPGHCRERVEVFFIGEAARDPELATARQTAVGRFGQFNAEDIAVVEALQRNFAAVANDGAAFDGGLLVPEWDGNVQRFQQLVLNAMAGG